MSPLLALLGVLGGLGAAAGSGGGGGSSSSSATARVTRNDPDLATGGELSETDSASAVEDTPPPDSAEDEPSVEDTPPADSAEDEPPVEDTPSGPCPKTGEAVCHCNDEDEHTDASGPCPKTGEAVCHCNDEDDNDGHGHHGGHDMPAIAPPPPGADQATLDAYVAAVRAQPETHAHGDDMGKMAEHMAAMDLAARADATHVAVSDGDWLDPATWYNGDIPDDDARVLIPDGINVQYGTVSDVSLFTVRVDGELDFATDMDSRMVFDTMVVGPTGGLIIGSETDPVDKDVSVELIVANNGPIDVDWDPMLLSRGLISHGETSIHGAAKDSHEKVVEDPMAGDTSITFADIPEGWEIGDTIVIAGTSYEGYKWDNALRDVRHYESEDEIRVITGFDGNSVLFEDPLEHDHDAPREDLKTSVANYTRNVSIETENGAEAEVFERGHVMFMHSDDVDVRYAEFVELGRTDKSELSMQHDDFAQDAYDNNVQGRYSVHLHRTGVEDSDNPAILEGNTVWGSPGWGFVHHDSNAILENNATFDTFGAGYVAETGNETGEWNDNIAIFAQGVSWSASKNTSTLSEDLFDTARGGEGFYFQGRLVGSEGNIAASVNIGFSYLHRSGDDRPINVDADQFDYPDVFYGDDDIDYSDVPILDFSGNEVFASRQGLAVVKAGPDQGHDVWTHIDDFTSWNVRTGVFLEYTSHYLLTDIDVIGKDPSAYSPSLSGIELGKGTGDIVIADSQIDNFTTGIDLNDDRFDIIPVEETNYTIVDTTITNAETEYANFNPALVTVTTRDELDGQDPDLELDPLLYDPATEGQWSFDITGTKSDSLGETDFPSGVDTIQLNRDDIARIIADDGYWTTSEGQNYFLLDVYFSDRLTGDIYYETHAVGVADAEARFFGKEGSAYSDAVYNGAQDIVTQNGVTLAGDIVLDQAFAAAPQVDMMQASELLDTLTKGQDMHEDMMASADDEEDLLDSVA